MLEGTVAAHARALAAQKKEAQRRAAAGVEAAEAAAEREARLPACLLQKLVLLVCKSDSYVRLKC